MGSRLRDWFPDSHFVYRNKKYEKRVYDVVGNTTCRDFFMHYTQHPFLETQLFYLKEPPLDAEWKKLQVEMDVSMMQLCILRKDPDFLDRVKDKIVELENLKMLTMRKYRCKFSAGPTDMGW